MELAVLNKAGKETGRTVKLDQEIFGIEPNRHAVYLDVKLYLANQRQGTHKSKERAEISGSTKKLKKQKGTGGARAGSIKSPLFVGGGRIFGPKPRDYSFKLNKKLRKLARRSALTYKAIENSIIIVEDFVMEAPKTKAFIDITKNLNIEGRKTLFVVNELDQNTHLSLKNLPYVRVVNAKDLNTYDLMNAKVLLMTEKAVSLASETLV